MATACRIVRLLALLLSLPVSADAQYAAHLGGPFSDQPMANAPFVADVTTSVRDQHPDGTIRTRSITARYFRDSRGQVRAELDTSWGPYIIVAKSGEEHLEFYRLDPATRTYMEANLIVARWIFNGEAGLPVPAANSCFEASPSAQGANDEERLKSVNAEVAPELGIVRASSRVVSEPASNAKQLPVQRSSEYELTNIRLEEPPASLFEIPGDYTVAAASPATPLVRWTSWSPLPNRCKVGERSE